MVDDSRLAAATLERLIGEIDPKGTCTVVTTAVDALTCCTDEVVDVAFLDIEMPGVNGLSLAHRLKRASPDTNVVFVTGYPEYALDAWNTHASAFLVKPVDEADVRRALNSLRIPLASHHGRGLFVRCFGSFEVFFDGVPVPFERSHTKELLAYLIDRRGAVVSMAELVCVLWEGQPDTVSRRSQLRTCISELRRTLDRIGRTDALIRRRGGVAINLADYECDYYGYMAGNPDAINSFRGEYLRQYSWGEETLATLLTGEV